MKTTVILTNDKLGQKEVMYLNGEGQAKVMSANFFKQNGITGETFEEVLEQLKALDFENDYNNMECDLEIEFNEDDYERIAEVATIA